MASDERIIDFSAAQITTASKNDFGSWNRQLSNQEVSSLKKKTGKNLAVRLKTTENELWCLSSHVTFRKKYEICDD